MGSSLAGTRKCLLLVNNGWASRKEHETRVHSAIERRPASPPDFKRRPLRKLAFHLGGKQHRTTPWEKFSIWPSEPGKAS